MAIYIVGVLAVAAMLIGVTWLRGGVLEDMTRLEALRAMLGKAKC